MNSSLKDVKMFYHYTNLSKADKYLRIRYKIYISMLRSQLYKGVKYFSANKKFQFQLGEFKCVKIFYHNINLSKADKYLRICYKIYISMLQFELYDIAKYFPANNKYKSQSGQFKFEMRENTLPLQKPVKSRQIFMYTQKDLHICNICNIVISII